MKRAQPKPAVAKERAVQREIVRDLRKIGLRCVHIPNGAHLAGDAEARARKWGAMVGDGAVPGFPDLLVMKPGTTPRTGFLEVKRPGTVPDTVGIRRQQQCRDAIAMDGFPVAVVQSVDEAVGTMRAWGFIL